jgi:hypothetical protein
MFWISHTLNSTMISSLLFKYRRKSKGKHYSFGKYISNDSEAFDFRATQQKSDSGSNLQVEICAGIARREAQALSELGETGFCPTICSRILQNNRGKIQRLELLAGRTSQLLSTTQRPEQRFQILFGTCNTIYC